MQPSEIGNLTFKQFSGYMDSIEKFDKKEDRGSSSPQSTKHTAALMFKRGIKVPK